MRYRMELVLTRLVMTGLLLAPGTTAAVDVSLEYCLDPLVVRDGFETPFDCSISPTADMTPAEFRQALGEGAALDLCVGTVSGPGYTLCGEPCGDDGPAGCAGTFEAEELVVSPNRDLVCGIYIVSIPDAALQYAGLDCSLEATGRVRVEVGVTSEFSGPRTWEILDAESEVADLDFSIEGCGAIGPLLDAVLPLFESSIAVSLETQIDETFSTLAGLGVCPVDRL